jgi:hypothetical protein
MIKFSLFQVQTTELAGEYLFKTMQALAEKGYMRGGDPIQYCKPVKPAQCSGIQNRKEWLNFLLQIPSKISLVFFFRSKEMRSFTSQSTGYC